MASIGFINGHPAGSAAPLTWSAASYVRLAANLGAGRLLDQPPNTVQRYIDHGQGQTSLTVTAPANESAISASPVTVTGTATPGDTVDALAVNTDNNMPATSATETAAADGSFSIQVPVAARNTVLSVAATSPDGATAHATQPCSGTSSPARSYSTSSIRPSTRTGRATTPARPRTTSSPGRMT